MHIIGLTGGIASGKSTVAKMFADLGVTVVDADKLAREVVEPGSPGLRKVIDAFGSHVLLPDGNLDRKALAEIVFSSESERLKLNGILHPLVSQASQDRFKEIAANGDAFAIYEVPLLVENNLHHAMHAVIVVSVPEPLQLERLMTRDGLSEEQATARLRAQMSLEEKVAVADYVIDNSQSRESTMEQVRDILQRLRDETA